MLGKLFARKSAARGGATVSEPGGFKYCPSCGDEFRPDFHHCSSCDCELVSTPGRHSRLPGSTDASRSAVARPIRPGETGLVPVSQGSLLDLKRVRNLLLKNGIASLIEGDGPDCLKSCCGGSKSFVIMVRREDLESAGSVLSQDFVSSTDLANHDFSSQQSGVFDERNVSTCPACGFQFIPDEPVCPECGLCFSPEAPGKT